MDGTATQEFQQQQHGWPGVYLSLCSVYTLFVMECVRVRLCVLYCSSLCYRYQVQKRGAICLKPSRELGSCLSSTNQIKCPTKISLIYHPSAARGVTGIGTSRLENIATEPSGYNINSASTPTCEHCTVSPVLKTEQQIEQRAAGKSLTRCNGVETGLSSTQRGKRKIALPLGRNGQWSISYWSKCYFCGVTNLSLPVWSPTSENNITYDSLRCEEHA